MVLEWATAHQSELLENWNLRVANEPLNEIDPLE
jgi:hypothetical protein